MFIEEIHRPQRCVCLRLAVTLVAGSALLLALLARFTSAQTPPQDHALHPDAPRTASLHHADVSYLAGHRH